MKRTGEYGASAKPTQMARIERPRARPPTVKEIKTLDTSESLVTAGVTDVPFEVTCRIAGYVIRLSDQKLSGSQLGELIKLQRICKGFRRASHTLMREEKNGEFQLGYGIIRDHMILYYLHPDYAERDELVRYRWGMSLNEWAHFRNATDCHYKRLPEVPDLKGKTYVETFDSTGMDAKTWSRQISGLRDLGIAYYQADPENLLAALAPQLEALEVAAAGRDGHKFWALLPAVHETLRELGCPRVLAREDEMKSVAAKLEKFSRLECVILNLQFDVDTQETGWIQPLFPALERMQKLASLTFIARGPHFNATQRTGMLNALRDFAPRCRTLLNITICPADGTPPFADPETGRILAENACYAPKEEETRQD